MSINRILLPIFISLLIPLSGLSEVLRHPYKAELRGLNKLKQQFDAGDLKQHGKGFKKIRPLLVTGFVSGEGVVQLKFDRARSQDWGAWISNGSSTGRDPRSVVLLKGEMTSERSARPVAGTLVFGADATPRITISFEQRFSRTTKRLVKLIAPLSDKEIEIASVQRAAGHAAGKSCGANPPPRVQNLAYEQSAASPNISHAVSQSATIRVADVSTDADPQFYGVYGSNTNSQIATIINEVDTIYNADLSVGLNIVAQHVYAAGGPYTSVVADTLLDQFQANGTSTSVLGNADIYHLFTAKTLLDAPGGDPGIIGIAFTGVVCRYLDEYSYGLTMYFNPTVTPITVAHEIGHNFDASHDTQIMGAVLSPPLPTGFSTFSKNEMTSYINANSSCLSTGSTSPTPVPTPNIPPSGGGSGSTPAGDPVPSVIQSTTLLADGTFYSTVTLGEVASGCDVVLTTSGKRASANRGSEIARSAADSTTKTFTGVVDRRTRTFTARGVRIKTFIGALLSCPTSGGLSAAGVIKIPSSRVRGVPAVGGKAFRSALAAAVDAQ